MPATRAIKLKEFIDVVQKNGVEEASTQQLRKGLKDYFGVQDRILKGYMQDLHRFGLIEPVEKGWRITNA